MVFGANWALALAVGSLATDDEVPAVEEQRERSVLFYLIDTCRGDRMGFNGYQRMTTPFLDWLAERSVVFEACFSQAPWTKPSMASMLSSQYPSTTGVYQMMHRLPDQIVTWPEVLQANGYYTAGFSSNIVMGNILSNYAQGFDHFVESTRINQGDPIRFASSSARKLNEHAFRWLDRTDHWPQLLYMHSVDPHEEYAPEPPYLEKFADPARDPAYRDEWKRLLRSRPPIPGLFVTQDNFDRAGVEVEGFIEHGSNLYDADILANDDQIERLWQKLQKDGWGDDFIFVLTSDHGEEFFEHGGTSHGYSLYNEMIRVPLMIYAPGLLPGGVKIRQPVRSLDIYPTLCDLLGLELPEGVQGESLVPLVEDSGSWTEKSVISEHREDPGARQVSQGSGVMVSLRNGPWKFIVNQESPQQLPRPRLELYDLEEDPGETTNVAEDYPDLVQQFEVEVARFVADHRAGAKVQDWVQDDPAVLDQLRKLGYLPAEEEGKEAVDEAGEGEPMPAEREAPPIEAVPAVDLWTAVAGDDLVGLRRALQRGDDPNAQQETFGYTPLSLSVLLGRIAPAEILLAWGAEVDAPNRDGNRALHGAVFLGQPDHVQLLLRNGADPRAPDATGVPPERIVDADEALSRYVVEQLLQLPFDWEALQAGRRECAELLRKRLEQDEG